MRATHAYDGSRGTSTIDVTHGTSTDEMRTGGQFITFEGPEGAGKTTQIERLRRRLEGTGIVVVQTREPGGTVIGQELRAMMLMPERPPVAPETEALLMIGDRAQHVAEVIRPALAAGMVVICDRYADSTIAYQGYGRGLDVAALESMNRFATGGLVPHLTILLDIDVRAGLDRKRKSVTDGDGEELNRIDRRDLSYHQRVRDGFLALAAREPDRFAVLDAAQDADALTEQLWQHVAALVRC
jgi:dTMP kinase